MRQLLYVIGIPGSGKSSLVAELVRGRRRRVHPKPFAHTIYEDGLVQLNRERKSHSGTDALSMSVMPYVLAALDTGVWPRVLAEGDRLANQGFFQGVRSAGYLLTVVLLDTPPEVAAERRAARGTTQNEAWVRGRVTKIDRLAGSATLCLDGTRPLEELAALLANHHATAFVLRP